MVHYQVSDLAGARRREFLDEAKRSSASLRDTDGTVLVTLTAQRVAALREAAMAASAVFVAEAVLERTSDPAPHELGSLAWLAEFDADDRREALAEVRDAVALAVANADPSPLREVLDGWATTANVMRDPLRRAVHTGTVADGDFIEVGEPGRRE